MDDIEPILRERLGDKADAILQIAAGIASDAARDQYVAALLEELAKQESSAIDCTEYAPLTILNTKLNFVRQPVDIEEFICGVEYLDKAGRGTREKEIYDKVLEELIKINCGDYYEVVFTGGIGSAKTTGAIYSIAYQLYLLSCLDNPHKAYGLDSASEIIFIFQSLNAKSSKNSYNRFKAMLQDCVYFQKHFPFDPNVDSKLLFPHRIEVTSGSGAETAYIGQNVVGGLIDELNYMSVVEKSAHSVDLGKYDQAVALYNSIARRRKTRFSKQGHMPGLLCLVSSARYPGQFTDLKKEEAKKDPSIYIYDYRVWEVKPAGSFSSETFNVYVGDDAHKPKILGEGDEKDYEDQRQVQAIPVDFKMDFEKDIINALREIAGVSTLARHPYFVNVEAVATGMKREDSIFSRDSIDFSSHSLLIYPKRFYKPEIPRAAHIDLAVVGDSAGIAIGCVTGFKGSQELGLSKHSVEKLPEIHIDGILEVRPPKNGEILFWKIRDVLHKCRELGLNIRWVTFDQFQSKDSMQLLKQQGFIVGQCSMDKDTQAYDFLKAAIYDGRFSSPKHGHCQRELLQLEKTIVNAATVPKNKIDHPPTGSKDCADALAGVAWVLSTRREIYGMYGISPVSIPQNVRAVQTKQTEVDDTMEQIA